MDTSLRRIRVSLCNSSDRQERGDTKYIPSLTAPVRKLQCKRGIKPLLPPPIQFTVDDIPELRQIIWLCRQFRQEASRRGDWRAEIFAERQTRTARQRYKAALRWLRCSH
jgi:hypothetical protein